MYSVASIEQQQTDLEMLATVMSHMSPRQLDVLAGLAHTERKTRKMGWRFYERVYIRYVGPANSNYLSNFLVARILDVDDTTIRMIGEDKKGRVFISYEHDGKGNSDSVYRAKDFAELRRKMIDEGKRVDTRYLNRMAPSSQQGNVATFDEAVAAHALNEEKLTRRSSAREDLVTLVSNMSRSMYGANYGPEELRNKKRKKKSRTKGDSEVSVDRNR